MTTKMVKKHQKVTKIVNISYLNELDVNSNKKNESNKKAYYDYLRNVNCLLLNHTPTQVIEGCYDVLCIDFEDVAPTDIQSYLLELPVSTVLKIKNLAVALVYYDAVLEDVSKMNILDAIDLFKDYLKRVAYLISFLVLASSTLSAQDGNVCKCGQTATFQEEVEMYYSESGLCEATIMKLFENQINKDWHYEFYFRKGELLKIVNGEITIPFSFQTSILKVIRNPKNYIVNENSVK